MLAKGNLVFVSNASAPVMAAWRLLFRLLKTDIHGVAPEALAGHRSAAVLNSG